MNVGIHYVKSVDITIEYRIRYQPTRVHSFATRFSQWVTIWTQRPSGNWMTHELVGIEAFNILAVILIKVRQSIVNEDRSFHSLRYCEFNDALWDSQIVWVLSGCIQKCCTILIVVDRRFQSG